MSAREQRREPPAEIEPSAPPSPAQPDDIAELVRLYEAKAAAEIAAAEALAPGAPASQGPAPADVMLVKGSPGPGDLAAGRALAGDDGRAAASALAALGLAQAPAFACCSRSEEADAAEAPARAARLALLVAAVEPRIVIALDALAAADLAAALGLASLALGRPVRHRGTTVLVIDGLEASLTDPARKRRVWRQLKILQDASAMATERRTAPRG